MTPCHTFYQLSPYQSHHLLVPSVPSLECYVRRDRPGDNTLQVEDEKERTGIRRAPSVRGWGQELSFDEEEILRRVSDGYDIEGSGLRVPEDLSGVWSRRRTQCTYYHLSFLPTVSVGFLGTMCRRRIYTWSLVSVCTTSRLRCVFVLLVDGSPVVKCWVLSCWKCAQNKTLPILGHQELTPVKNEGSRVNC